MTAHPHGAFELPTSRIPRAGWRECAPGEWFNNPGVECLSFSGYTPEEILARRWHLLDMEIEHAFRDLRRNVRREFSKLAAWVPLRVAIETERVALPVNAGDDGRWGDSTRSTNERNG